MISSVIVLLLGAVLRVPLELELEEEGEEEEEEEQEVEVVGGGILSSWGRLGQGGEGSAREGEGSVGWRATDCGEC